MLELNEMKKLDYFGNEIKLPAIGDKVFVDGYIFTVTEVHPVDDISIISSIVLIGDSGSVETGYYNFIKHEKAVC